MRDEASSGDFRFVICWDQDRFGRFDLLDAGYWIKPFRDAGVALVTLNDGVIDWTSFTGRVMYSIKQEGKHQFLRDLSRNVLRGQVEAAKNGSWIGQVPYAYVLQGPRKNRKLVLGDASQVKVVKRIFREFVDEGRSLNEIAKRLTADGILTSGGGAKWRYDSVKCILSNPVYTGTYRYNTSSRCKYHFFHKGVITEGTREGRNDAEDQIVLHNNHPAIIGQRTFDSAQAILAKGKTGRNRYTPETNPYLLHGLLRCGHCGEPLWGMNGSKGRRMYECSRKQEHKDCEGTTVREDAVLDHLVEYVETEFLPVEGQVDLMNRAERGELRASDVPEAFAKIKKLVLGKMPKVSSPERIKKQLKALDEKRNKMKRNLALVDPENIPVLQDEIRKVDAEHQELQRELKSQPKEQEINQVVLDVLRKLFWLCKLEPESLKPMLRELSHITVHSESTGKSRRTRHVFCRGEIHFKSFQGVTSKSNPHLLGQSQAAYR